MQDNFSIPISETKRACPICACLRTVLYHHQRFSKQFDGSLLSGYDIVVCEECGFGFADYIPPQSEINKYYALLSKYEQETSVVNGSSYDTERFRDVTGVILQTLLSKECNVLDVGCATGELLGMLKEKGCSNIVGLDPAPACAQIGERLYGVKIQTGDIFNLPRLGKTFDYVILNHVMEHIHDLGAAIHQLRAVLSPHGRVMVEVPDATRFASYPDAPYQEFSTEHINFFSPISIANLMGTNGFRQIYCERFERHQRASAIMPVVNGVYELTDTDSFQILKDQDTGPALETYINRSKAIDEDIKGSIESLVQARTPLIIWGVGTHTLRLLVESRLNEANITAFVDANPKYWQMELNNAPVLSPQAIQNRDEAILISSRIYQDEIERIIRDELRMKNKVIKLYKL